MWIERIFFICFLFWVKCESNATNMVLAFFDSFNSLQAVKCFLSSGLLLELKYGKLFPIFLNHFLNCSESSLFLKNSFL